MKGDGFVACATVLIADDEELVRTVCRLALEDKYTVFEAGNGEEAWKLILAKRPDVVLTDMVMPRLHGLDLADRIKSHPELRFTLVILMTGATEGEELPDGFWRMGTVAEEFIQKPVEVQAIRAMVDRLIERRVRPVPPPRGGYL